jgi:tetratricopeptide (TPR) repeat protein
MTGLGTTLRSRRSARLIAALAVSVALAAGTALAQTPNSEVQTPVLEHFGTHHVPITTTSQQAQLAFDQGIRLVYAFNHAEAIRSFEEALRHDASAAMAYWGIAYALGPNINAPMDKLKIPRALEAIKKAKALDKQVTPRERAYIAALGRRYSASPRADRKALDRAYAKAMRDVTRRFPDDLDAATLAAEALMDARPWDYWTKEGKPQPGTQEIVALLEGVLKQNPEHPGACHYYIHAVEASPEPQRALACADRLPELMPGAGHAVHMPAHIYMRLGLYDKAAERNRHAADVDQAYLKERRSGGLYPTLYVPHNLHFLWAALAMGGRSRESIQAARELAQAFTFDQARQTPELEIYTPTVSLALVRFGEWSSVLQESAPPEDLLFTTGIWRFARGLALTRLERLDEAEHERRQLAALEAGLRPERLVDLNSAKVLLKIAGHVLAGELSAARGNSDAAVKELKQAVMLEDGLVYAEPSNWYAPVRQHLGALLLAAGRSVEAEAVYREDLQRHPENGWSLFGLAAALRVQKKDQDVASVEQRFLKAWARADVVLTSSRF